MIGSLPALVAVGTGPVARALVRGWSDAGGPVAAVISRDPSRSRAVAAACGAPGASADLAGLGRAGIVVVAVPDRAVAGVGEMLRTAGAVCPVLHTSGVLAASELGAGLLAGSLHPLQSFPSGGVEDGGRSGAARLPGTHWFHEGEGLEVARTAVAAWRGAFHALAPGAKSLYHAAAVMVSNHTVTLFADATACLDAAGIAPEASRPALAALLAGTAANLASLGAPEALTGPVARGDVATVRRHVDALRRLDPGLLAAYAVMARRTVRVARAKGTLSEPFAVEILAVLDGA